MGDHCWIVAVMPAEQKQLIRASQIAAHKTPSAPESPLSLCYVTERERRGEWDCACAQYLLYLSMWETYFWVRFDNRNGRLKQLQSFWYNLYIASIQVYIAVLNIWVVWDVKLGRCVRNPYVWRRRHYISSKPRKHQAGDLMSHPRRTWSWSCMVVSMSESS